MKRHVTHCFIATALFAIAGVAGAAERQSLATVNVKGLDCTPPNAANVCSAWHEEIRRNFSVREIGMLFGAATSYPESLTSYNRVKERYEKLQNSFAATHLSTEGIAAK